MTIFSVRGQSSLAILLPLGGYSVWEIARDNPHTSAAIAPVCRASLDGILRLR